MVAEGDGVAAAWGAGNDDGGDGVGEVTGGQVDQVGGVYRFELGDFGCRRARGLRMDRQVKNLKKCKSNKKLRVDTNTPILFRTAFI